MNYATEIKKRVKLPQVVRFYGLMPNRQNRVPCPFHGGTNPNLGIKDDFCRCFKCGYTADIFKFVQDFFGISFQEAVHKLNDDFSLALPIGGTGRREAIEAERKAFEEAKKRKHKEEGICAAQAKYFSAIGEFARLEKNRLKYQPRTADDVHPLFVEAVKNIEAAKYEIFCAEEDWKRELAKNAD